MTDKQKELLAKYNRIAEDKSQLQQFAQELILGEIGMTEESVKDAIQADKDILSQIVYDKENHTITFPKGVLPLIVRTSSQEFFFDYNVGSLIMENGSSSSDTVENANSQVIINDTEENYFVDDNIISIEYIHFNGGDCYLNTFYIYYPNTESGTKLYKHTLLDLNDEEIIIINNDPNIINTSSWTSISNLLTYIYSKTNVRITDSANRVFIIGQDEIYYSHTSQSGVEWINFDAFTYNDCSDEVAPL